MVEDYAIQMRTGKAEPTGKYTINRRRNRVNVLSYRETYKTKAGDFPPEKWKKLILAEVEKDGKSELYEKIKEFCKKHFAWLHTESEIEEHALECLASHAYKYWNDFEETKNE